MTDRPASPLFRLILGGASLVIIMWGIMQPLEGCGALGLAHIGVIQYLVEHCISVSYVAGTSMGGLAGGVFAPTPQASALFIPGKVSLT